MMNKPFTLDSLDQIKPKDLKTFKDSEIHQKMESGEMKRGQQIWIFHDGTTDRWNCIANVNPYAHVVVFVGSKSLKDKKGGTKMVHEVVHVSKSWKCCTDLKAEICREDVMKVVICLRFCWFHQKIKNILFQVIKPDNMVFLGHPLKEHQLSANAGEAIAERAIKCSRRPVIRFDYDYK